jgi:hypothetical protein
VNASLKPFLMHAAEFPDKKVANFVEEIAKETVSRLYDDAAKQVSKTG